MTTKKILATSLALATLTLAGVTTAATARGSRSVEADSMIGVPSALTGAQAPIRGINGGGIAWSIGKSSVEVTASGKVEVEFNDLVLAAGGNIGKNPVGTMKVIVSCLDAAGATVNVSTPTFPVTIASATDPGGDGEFEGRVALPSPCIAPMVFITNAAGSWFAVDGL